MEFLRQRRRQKQNNIFRRDRNFILLFDVHDPIQLTNYVILLSLTFKTAHLKGDDRVLNLLVQKSFHGLTLHIFPLLSTSVRVRDQVRWFLLLPDFILIIQVVSSF